MSEFWCEILGKDFCWFLHSFILSYSQRLIKEYAVIWQRETCGVHRLAYILGSMCSHCNIPQEFFFEVQTHCWLKRPQTCWSSCKQCCFCQQLNWPCTHWRIFRIMSFISRSQMEQNCTSQVNIFLWPALVLSPLFLNNHCHGSRAALK